LSAVAQRRNLGLRGQFSNLSRPVSDLLSNSLTSLDEDQGLEEVRTTSGWPDGRRKFGTVGSAIVDVLSDAGGELSVKAIRIDVERALGGRVSRFSVADYLLVRSKGAKPLFERTRHGHYRLLL
jgi:hypothetical protein